MSSILGRLKSKHHNPITLLRLLAYWASPNPLRPTSPLDQPCSLVIPTAGKDFAVLPLAVESVQRFFQGPLTQIVIVSPPFPDIKAFVEKRGWDWACENDFLDPCVASLQYRPCGINRTGWIKQQLLKLGGDRIVSNRRFLVLDSDTVFVRPIAFMEGGKYTFYFSNEYNQPYFVPCQKFLGLKKRFRFSFVTHSMFFDSKHLQELRGRIEAKTGKPWQESILDILDPDEASCFSEYELYGNFMAYFHPDRIVTRYWHNHSVPREGDLDSLVARYGHKFNSVSMHDFSN